MNVSCPECSTVYRVDPAKVPQGGVRARCSTCNGVISIGMVAAPAAPPPRQTPTDPIGDAFAQRRPTPAPFAPAQASRTFSSTPPAPTPAGSFASAARTAPPTPRVPPPPSQARVSTPPAQPTVATPIWQPKVPTPPTNPRVQKPTHPTASLGATLPPTRATPQAPWHPPTPKPISVPPFTPPAASAVAPAVVVPSAPAQGERRPINPFLARDPGLRAKRLARALVSDMVAYYPAKHSEGLEKGTLKELFKDEIKKSYDEYVGQVGAEFARTTTHFQESLNEVLGAGKKIF
ncbi:MAG: zinc-ribbon domain-containing protein [Gemmatimonadaceae bacterium]